MGALSNETIYYGGLLMAALAIIFAIVSGLVLTIRTMRLSARFDEEYGKKKQT